MSLALISDTTDLTKETKNQLVELISSDQMTTTRGPSGTQNSITSVLSPLTWLKNSI